MNKKQWMIPLSAFLAFGLSGCANDNRTAMDREHKNFAQPIGYYSNENHPNGSNVYFEDNDGPITEFMDHNLGDEGRLANDRKRSQLQRRDKNGHLPNPEYQDNITGKIRQKAAAVRNVKYVRSVTYGNTIMIAVDIKDHRRKTETIKAIQNAVKPYSNGKSVQVFLDDGSFGRNR